MPGTDTAERVDDDARVDVARGGRWRWPVVAGVAVGLVLALTTVGGDAPPPAGTAQPAPGATPAGATDPEPEPERGAAPAFEVRPTALPSGSVWVRWTTEDPTTGLVELRGRDGDVVAAGSSTDLRTDHLVVLDGARPETRLELVVTATAADGTDVEQQLTLRTPAAGVADATTTDMRLGTTDDTTVTGELDGTLRLAAALDEEFRIAGAPDGISTDADGDGGAFAGRLTLDGARWDVPTRVPASGATLTTEVTFTGPDQQVGLDGNGRSATVRTVDGRLVLSVDDGTDVETTGLDAAADGPVRLQLAWTDVGASVSVDEVEVARVDVPVPSGPTAGVLADAIADGLDLVVDAISLGPVEAAGGFTSRVHDTQQMVTWRRASWDADVPDGTRLQVEVRTGSRATPDGTWTPWRPLADDGATIGGASRFLQYRVAMTSADGRSSPVLRAIGFTHDGVLGAAEGEDHATESHGEGDGGPVGEGGSGPIPEGGTGPAGDGGIGPIGEGRPAPAGEGGSPEG